MSDAKRKRGRPVTIDTGSAMEAVVELFRSKGYAAVSLDDLSEATGLSRPSLYRAFGNKLSMYINAMDTFGKQVAELAVPKLLQEDDLESALERFFEAMLSIYYRSDEIAPGCLVFGTAPSSADEEAIRARLLFGVEQIDNLMRHRMLQSAPGCAPATLEAAVHLASNTLIAFSVRAKSGASREALEKMGAQSARAISTLLGD